MDPVQSNNSCVISGIATEIVHHLVLSDCAWCLTRDTCKAATSACKIRFCSDGTNTTGFTLQTFRVCWPGCIAHASQHGLRGVLRSIVGLCQAVLHLLERNNHLLLDCCCLKTALVLTCTQYLQALRLRKQKSGVRDWSRAGPDFDRLILESLWSSWS